MTISTRPESIGDESAFLRVVVESQERRCQEIEEQAKSEAREIVRGARSEAKRRVGQAVAENRKRSRNAIELARARRAAEVRLALQQANRRWLDAAWPGLLASLDSAWRDREMRSRWIFGVIERALSVLSRRARFRIEHPADLDPSELMPGALEIERRTGGAPEIAADPALANGIRVSADSAILDGSIDGLLAHRELIEGRLLAEIRGALEAGDPRGEL